jgi:hypothetical protein
VEVHLHLLRKHLLLHKPLLLLLLLPLACPP